MDAWKVAWLERM
jgi:acyl-CoA thioesterase